VIGGEVLELELASHVGYGGYMFGGHYREKEKGGRAEAIGLLRDISFSRYLR
jgi:hypothetical protein